MDEITIYFGSETIKLFLDDASENIKDFKLQTFVTKLELVWFILKNEIYKQAVSELVEKLDEEEADRDLKDIILKKLNQI